MVIFEVIIQPTTDRMQSHPTIGEKNYYRTYQMWFSPMNGFLAHNQITYSLYQPTKSMCALWKPASCYPKKYVPSFIIMVS